ncbi:hypothetical protein C8A05DRAFT_46781 [Staphylotrichum tortipilum]|uniref:Uncharacterized protein n=1 Tax=Staphylotrichum tortipilum TaxID=2831512 RepID=A0AAN6ME08_9PEZI|nr:hypothetical protein C8A05DRAFT_46781 [Staphylotrichum longicolle]
MATTPQVSKIPKGGVNTNPQTGSLLFRKLPQEMRNQIYTELFTSTRFSFGDRPASPSSAHADISTMLSKLSALPTDTLSQLRRAALTVLGEPAIPIGYDTLGGLARDPNRWRTLRYIAHSSELLGFPPHFADWTGLDDYRRRHQPRHWQAVLEGHDGAASRPEVRVYRAREPGQHGAVLNPARRERFEQKPREEGGQAGGLGWCMRRRRTRPLLESDIRRELPGMPWSEIREMCIDGHESPAE